MAQKAPQEKSWDAYAEASRPCGQTMMISAKIEMRQPLTGLSAFSSRRKSYLGPAP